MMSMGEVMRMKRVTAKLGKMRKSQDFMPQRRSDGLITVQSDKCIGTFDPVTRKGVLCTTGCYFIHLSMALPFDFPNDFIDQCIAAVGNKATYK